MRLDTHERAIITSTLKELLGDVTIVLFGSRVDDRKKGGDIDLYVALKRPVSLEEEMRALATLERRGVERKIDLLVDAPLREPKPFYTQIRRDGVVLC